jgi:TP901 family phage tail tape measure protein
MAVRTEQLQLRILIDGTPARRELAQLDQEYAKISASLSRMKRGTQEYIAAGARMAEIRQRQSELREEIGLTALTAKQLGDELKRLQAAQRNLTPNTEQWAENADRIEQVKQRLKELNDVNARSAAAWEAQRHGIQLNRMSIQQLEQESQRLNAALRQARPNTPEFRALHRELGQVNARLTELRTGLGPLGRAWESIKSQIASAAAVVGTFFVGSAVIEQMRGLVTGSAELSDAMADISRVTGMTNEEVRDLISSFKEFDTRTARKELMDLAYDAGKLGIQGKNDVLEFVRAGDQIRTALGRDLGDEAIQNIAKITDLFRLKETYGIEQSLLKVGSTINDLGAASTASEGYMVSFMKRLGGVAPLAGITVDQTLALGATLDSLGQTSEVSSTAISGMFMKMANNAEEYARIAGMSVEQFKETMNRNALDAFIKVIEAAGRTEGGIIQLSQTLGDMGVESSRAAGVFGVLANNTDMLRQQMDIASESFIKGTSITNEFNTKNNTLAAQLEKLRKEIFQTFMTPGVMDAVEGWVASMRSFLTWIRENSEAIKFWAKVLTTATLAWVNYRIAVAAAAAYSRVAMAVTRAWGMVKAAFTGQVNLSTLAMRGFNAVLRMNPIGLVVSALTTVVGLFWAFSEEVSNAAEAQDQLNQSLEEGKRVAQDMDKLRKTSEVSGQLNNDQLENHKRNLETALAENEKYHAEALAQETAATRNLSTEQAKLIRQQRDLFKKADTAAKEEDRTSARLQAYSLFSAIRSYDDRILEAKRKLNLSLSAEQADANRKELKAQIDAVNARINVVKNAATTEKRTIAVIDEEIKNERERLQNAGTRAEYSAIEANIRKLEGERRRITGESLQKNAQQQEDHLRRLQEQMEELRERIRMDQLSEDERELAQLDNKHAKEIDKVRKQQAELIKAKRLSPDQAATDLDGLRNSQTGERTDLLEKQSQRRIEAARQADAELRKLLQDSRTAQLEAELERLDEEIELAKQRGDSTYLLEQRRTDTELRLHETRALALIEQETLKWDELIAAAKRKLEEYDANMKALGLADDEQALVDRKMLSDRIIQLEQAQSATIENINRARRRREAAAERSQSQSLIREQTRKLQNFAQIANAMGGLASSITAYMDATIRAAEQRADADGVRTDEEIANIERLKRAKRTAALVAIAAEGAAAIANGVAQAMTLPYPANVAAGIATVAAVISLIAQARTLLSEAGENAPEPKQVQAQPALESVPLGAKGGIFSGPGHDAGGLKVVDPQARRVVAEVEGGEPWMVLSRAFRRNNPGLIPLLLHASATGEHVPIGARGGIFQPMPAFDFRGASAAMRLVHLAQGGIVGQGRAVRAAALADVPDEAASQRTTLLLEAMLAKLQDLDQGVRAFPGQLHAKVALGDLERRKTEQDYIADLNKARRVA